MSALLAAHEGEILVLTLNRADKANAMNEAMHGEICKALKSAGEDDGVRAVVLTGAGPRVFSAGADLKEFSDLERDLAARRRRVLLQGMLNAALDFPKPLVAAVQGKALGAGCMLALLADEIVMADTAELGLPEIRHGIPTPVGYVIVAARAGMAVARRMVQGGEPVTAKQAQDWVDLVCDASSLQSMAMEKAKRIAKHPGASFAANKKFINNGLRAAVLAAFAEADRL